MLASYIMGAKNVYFQKLDEVYRSVNFQAYVSYSNWCIFFYLTEGDKHVVCSGFLVFCFASLWSGAK